MGGCGDGCGSGCKDGCGDHSEEPRWVNLLLQKPAIPAAEPIAVGAVAPGVQRADAGGRSLTWRQLTPPFRVFFTWDIQYACNYRCTYCIVFESPQWESQLSKKDRPALPAERWIEIWNDIYNRYGSCHIHCSGGEPFYYPRFIDILQRLTEKHTMECDTNLSFDVEKFIGRVRPGTFRFAPSFHPEYAKIDEYIDKCKRLRAAGYDLEGVNYIAWPPHLERMPEFKEAFKKIGVVLSVIPFRGKFQGKDYPDAYTLEQRRFLNQLSGNPILTEDYGNSYKGDGQGCNPHTTREPAACRAGQMYAKIHPDGNAIRCCYLDERGSIGNLIDGTFSLYDDPKVCEYPACSCWKSMLVGEEGRWLRHWVGVRR